MTIENLILGIIGSLIASYIFKEINNCRNRKKYKMMYSFITYLKSDLCIISIISLLNSAIQVVYNLDEAIKDMTTK